MDVVGRKLNSTWAWKLVPLAGARTRLLTRLKQYNDWGHASTSMAALTVVLFESATSR